jgi:hypothetical protein
MLNPTLIATWSAACAALFATRWVPFRPSEAIPFGAAVALGIATWFVVLVALIRKLHHKLPERMITWSVRAVGSVLVALGCVFAVECVRWLANGRGA